MIIPNISKFGKAVILSKKSFPFVYKAHAHLQYFYNICTKFRTDRLKYVEELVNIAVPSSMSLNP